MVFILIGNEKLGKQMVTAEQGESLRKVVVVTGGTAGVGRAIAEAFAARGDRVAVLARGEAGLSATADAIRAKGGEALALKTDVSHAEQVQKSAAEIINTWGKIDIWINNAMVSIFSPVSEMSPQEIKQVTEVTYLGVVYGTMTALKYMKAAESGSIIQIGSALGSRSIPLQSAYCGAKHAIDGFTESLRVELMHEKSKIKLTILELPAVNTPQFDWVKSMLPKKAQPVPPVYQPEVIAEAAVWASIHHRRRWAIGYPTVQALLAEKYAPAVADWYLAKNGYSSQQTKEPEDPKRENNLFHPVDRDAGAHGRFDSIARTYSVQWWLNKNRGAIAFGALGILVGALALNYSSSRDLSLKK